MARMKILVLLTVMVLVAEGGTTTESSLTTDGINETDVGMYTQEPTTAEPIGCLVPGVICKNNGSCSENGTCVCAAYYGGMYCETLIKCPDTYCNDTGTYNCTVINNTPTCSCIPGITGERCGEVDTCYNNPCNNNNGTCRRTNGGYICDCPVGNRHKNCSLNEKNECLEQLPFSFEKLLTCIDRIGEVDYYCQPYAAGDGCSEARNATEYCMLNHCDSSMGYCQPLCNMDPCDSNCDFTAEPWQGHNATERCIKQFGNGYETSECLAENELFDGLDKILGDLQDCSPFYDTTCTRSVSNATCNPNCNNVDCLWDGMACFGAYMDIDFLDGSVVVQFYDDDSLNNKHVLGLMLRSMVQYDEHVPQKLVSVRVVDPKRLAEMNVSTDKVGNFTSVGYASRFLAAFIAKRPFPFPLKVVDVYVCQAGTYGDKCKNNCSSGCAEKGDVCHWNTGKCLHGCKENKWGDACDQTCPFHCKNGCSRTGVCIGCEKEWFGDMCDKSCDKYCLDDSCTQKTGECNCEGPNMEWHGTKMKCTCRDGYHGPPTCEARCSATCINMECEPDTGTCKRGCDQGHYTADCSAPCPGHCKECNRESGKCTGKCNSGYTGDNCQTEVSNQTAEKGNDNTGIIVAVIVAIIIIAVILLGAFCYWRQKQSGDYILDEEEGKNDQAKSKSNQLELEASALQPASPMMGRSSDMIDMDEGNAGVYVGQKKTASTSSIAETNNQVSTITIDIKNSEVRVDKNTKQGDPPAEVKVEPKTVSDSPENSPLLDDDGGDDADIEPQRLELMINMAPLATPEVSMENLTEDIPPPPTSPPPPLDDEEVSPPSPAAEPQPPTSPVFPPAQTEEPIDLIEDSEKAQLGADIQSPDEEEGMKGKDISSRKSSTSSSGSRSSSSSSDSHDSNKKEPTTEM